MVRVAANRRFLEDEAGRDFMYLGDTAWELFHRLTFAEACEYLDVRAAQGFTVIQAVILAELDGLRTPNAHGELPFLDEATLHPNPAYFAHVDRVVAYANTRGLVMGLLPTWGDKWNQKWGKGPVVFDEHTAYTYGQFVGHRYQDAQVIWILGGDRPVETPLHAAVVTAMARGLRAGDGGRHLCTFHPMGQQSSSLAFHDADWLDFHMLQSGHGRNRDNWRSIGEDYAREPVRPCMDGEPGYEEHPAGFQIEQGYLDAYDARKACYWALFAGAHGHTYGCHPIWQFWEPKHGQPATWARMHWRDALTLPGAMQMQHAKTLWLRYALHDRIPDQAMIAGDVGAGTQHLQACRNVQGTYAMIYAPANHEVHVDTTRLCAGLFVAQWYDPRTGAWQTAGMIDGGQSDVCMVVPVGGPDWVLVLEHHTTHASTSG